ncbi:uncharacterized protein LOC131007902 [Salvia miltiorrhiza]|uniref:uncharacterized protein LOC131007902 n=1 Tax=Salvia miltiorrhiza TaxID=226208 RepID=UPI0025AB6362|nr:uncharacterized protein LOC131007902 [Salvia miltiorrhiza]
MTFSGEKTLKHLTRLSTSVKSIRGRLATPKQLLEWVPFSDGSITKDGGGVGIYIASLAEDVLQFAVKMEYKISNNDAEYEATIKALQMLVHLNVEKVILYTDSQLVAQQFMGHYEVREERIEVYSQKLKTLSKKFEEFVLQQVPKFENGKVDMLARMASALDQI